MSFDDHVYVRRNTADKRQLDNLRRAGVLVNAHSGIYIRAGTLDRRQRWLADLQALVARAGPQSAVSRRAAARLHGLEGRDTEEHYFVEAIAPITSSARGPTIVRSRTLTVDDVVEIGGLRVTSVARTLCDLGTKVSSSCLEQALESAVRGRDPKQPDVWNASLLAELVECTRVVTPRSGQAMLRQLLQARSDGALPTGSLAETMALQALRKVGFNPTTQARIDVRMGQQPLIFWADLADLDRGLIVEIDGLEAHGSASAQDRDHRRQNVVTEALTMLRFSATTVLDNPRSMVTEVLRRRNHLRVTPNQWRVGAVNVVRQPGGWLFEKAR